MIKFALSSIAKIALFALIASWLNGANIEKKDIIIGASVAAVIVAVIATK